jgi:hypothetical protein
MDRYIAVWRAVLSKFQLIFIHRTYEKSLPLCFAADFWIIQARAIFSRK